MRRRVLFRPIASLELDEAIGWYEKQNYRGPRKLIYESRVFPTACLRRLRTCLPEFFSRAKFVPGLQVRP